MRADPRLLFDHDCGRTEFLVENPVENARLVERAKTDSSLAMTVEETVVLC